ncbi:MAG: DedA family protein [Crocinitomicaceae bacterium]|nr:DedA family protein [Crocinitomicaceae bacterium]MDG1777019.1 DedA family protein [Crocinitomicaceae bacterium]
MDYLEYGYFGLFTACFLAATILPFASEGALLLFLAAGFDPTVSLIVAASGNTLGGLTNYLLGLIGNPKRINSLFSSPKRHAKFEGLVKRYGYWLGLVSWLPIVGDPLTILLGFFRVKFMPFLILMVLAKLLRYSLIIFIWNS